MKSYAFSKMIHDETKRRNFIFDTIKYVKKKEKRRREEKYSFVFFVFSYINRHRFDGLEIDWEYPGIRGGQADDRHYLTLLIQVSEKEKKNRCSSIL